MSPNSPYDVKKSITPSNVGLAYEILRPSNTDFDIQIRGKTSDGDRQPIVV